MKRFLVIQHSYSEFLGGFERLLEDRHIGFSYCRPFLGDAMPATGLHHDALWILGGPDPIAGHARPAYADEELRLITRFRRAQRPIVGIGYGALLVALQCGGTVEDETVEHAEFTCAKVTVDAQTDPLAAVLDGQSILVFHRGDVCLPVGVPALVCDAHGRWLLARPDPLTYALLFRPEHKPGMLEDMVMEHGRQVPAHIGELIAESRDRWDATQALASRVMAALVGALDLMRERRKPRIIPVRSIGDPVAR